MCVTLLGDKSYGAAGRGHGGLYVAGRAGPKVATSGEGGEREQEAGSREQGAGSREQGADCLGKCIGAWHTFPMLIHLWSLYGTKHSSTTSRWVEVSATQETLRRGRVRGAGEGRLG